MKLINKYHISFKSEPYWFLKEMHGKKANTVRFLEGNELNIVMDYMVYIDKITIINVNTGESFTRELTDVSILPVDDVLIKGKLIIFSWRIK